MIGVLNSTPIIYRMARKKIQREPKTRLGFNEKTKICYNCMFYGKDGFCPWEMKYMNYNDKCSIVFKNWPHSSFRYRLDLPYKLVNPFEK